MTELTHDHVRDALADHDPSPEVGEHLRRCAACRRFAEIVDRVDAVVARMEPSPAPDDLADRVLSALSDRRSGRAMGRAASIRRMVHRSAIAVAAAAAVFVGALFVDGERRHAPQDAVLIAAAEHLETDRTSAVQMEGTVDVTVHRAGSDPDFSSLPPELEGYFEAQWLDMIARFERSMAEFEAQIDAHFGEIDGLLDDFAAPAPPSHADGPADLPGSAPDEPAPPPDDLSLRMRVVAAGMVDVRGRVEIAGMVRPLAGTLRAPDEEVGFGVSVQDLNRTLRLPDGSGASLPSTEGAWGAVLLRPDGLPELLRAAEGPVRARGTTHIGGEEVVRYRFRADGRDVEAFIGSDGRLRALTLREDEDEGNVAWRSVVELTITGHGVELPDREQLPVAPDATVPAAGSGAALYPFGPAVAEALVTGP